MKCNLMPSVILPSGFIWHLCSKMFMGKMQKTFSMAPLQGRIWIQSVSTEISVGLCWVTSPTQNYWCKSIWKGQEELHLAFRPGGRKYSSCWGRAETKHPALVIDRCRIFWGMIVRESIELEKELLERFSFFFYPRFFPKSLMEEPYKTGYNFITNLRLSDWSVWGAGTPRGWEETFWSHRCKHLAYRMWP